MSLGCWAMAHGCPCLPTKATRPRPVKANAAGRCLAGTWGAKNSSQCLGTKPVVGKLRNRWCWRIWGYIFWIFLEHQGNQQCLGKSTCFTSSNGSWSMQHQARRRYLGHSGKWAHGERAVDGMATSSHWFILSSDMRWWCEAHSPAACYDWRILEI